MQISDLRIRLCLKFWHCQNFAGPERKLAAHAGLMLEDDHIDVNSWTAGLREVPGDADRARHFYCIEHWSRGKNFCWTQPISPEAGKIVIIVTTRGMLSHFTHLTKLKIRSVNFSCYVHNRRSMYASMPKE